MTQSDSLTDAALGHLTCSPTTQSAAAAASVMATPRCVLLLLGSRNTTSAQTSAMVIVHEVCLPWPWQRISIWKLEQGQQQPFHHCPFWKDALCPTAVVCTVGKGVPQHLPRPGTPPTTTPPASCTLSSGGTGNWLGIAAATLSPVGQPPFTHKRVSLLSLSFSLDSWPSFIKHRLYASHCCSLF